MVYESESYSQFLCVDNDIKKMKNKTANRRASPYCSAQSSEGSFHRFNQEEIDDVQQKLNLLSLQRQNDLVSNN